MKPVKPVKLTARTSLIDVAFAVGDALRAAGIRAVLTGGACVTLHTDAAYVSHDLDFVLQKVSSPDQLDDALGTLGFRRVGNQYMHADTRFYVEFPPGPLAIGGDYGVKPVELRKGRSAVLVLSPTDSCMDRLAAFYHWRDRQSLLLAVAVARHRKVDLDRIAKWSRAEGHELSYQEFLFTASGAFRGSGPPYGKRGQTPARLRPRRRLA